MLNIEQDSIPAHLFRIARAMRKLNPSSDIPTELTQLQVQALLYIKNQGPSTIKELGVELNISPTSATLLTDRLVAAGYVLRTPSTEDRRKVTLSLTSKTVEKMRQQHARMHERGELMVKDLTLQETAEMNRILTKIETTLSSLISSNEHSRPGN